MITIPQRYTDGRTDGQLALAIPRYGSGSVFFISEVRVIEITKNPFYLSLILSLTSIVRTA